MAVTLFLGFLFGAMLQYANLNRFNVITGMAILENFTVAKAIATAIGIGAILMSIEVGLGLSSWHVKPVVLSGIIMGGIIFGAGMALLGYCPGTLAISAGEGSMDAVIGIAGGLTAGLLYTFMAPAFKNLLVPDLGAVSLASLTGINFTFYLITFLLGSLLIAVAFLLHKKDNFKDYKWLASGIALAILNAALMLEATANKTIGASTAFPYLADLIFGATQNNYFNRIQNSGNWQVIFLGGAFLAGLLISIIRKEFRIVLIHKNWQRFKGSSSVKRMAWAFAGGFLLIFGARVAGGCTSGHILSGGMQMAVSSWLFAIFAFSGLVFTGKLFYK